MPTQLATRAIDRVVATLLLLLMAAGCLALWIAVPAVVLSTLTRLSDSKNYHLLVALFAVPAAMIAFAPLLLWLNALYLRVTGQWRLDEDEQRHRRLRGPLEALLVWSLLVAFGLLCLWFAFPSSPPAPV
jgi:succinate dehydrogenase hydrophobic anchor subunit